MDPFVVLGSMLGIILFLIFIGVPIAVALGISTTFGLMVFVPMDHIYIVRNVYTSLNNYGLLAVPFFILAANVIVEAGIAKRLIALAEALTSGLRGGLGVASVLSCAIFAAISGSSAATVIAIGTIMLPGMVAAGYDKKFSTAMLSCSGSLGVLIPPSTLLIIYAVLAEESVGRLFAAGMLPGILLTICFMIYTYIYSSIKKYPIPPSKSLRERLTICVKSAPSLFVPFAILGGIYSGMVTPTESAILGVALGLLIGIFVYRELDIKRLPTIVIKSAEMSSMILLILSFAFSFAWIIEFYRVPHELARAMMDVGIGPILFLFILNIMLIIAGQFLDPGSIILIFAPVLVGIANIMGIDTVHLGIIIVLNMELGLISPPVGFNLYVGSSLSGYDIFQLVRPILPIMLMMFIVLMVVTYVPEISLFLPNLIFG